MTTKATPPALRDYVQHKPECLWHRCICGAEWDGHVGLYCGFTRAARATCTCGLSALLAAPAEPRVCRHGHDHATPEGARWCGSQPERVVYEHVAEPVAASVLLEAWAAVVKARNDLMAAVRSQGYPAKEDDVDLAFAALDIAITRLRSAPAEPCEGWQPIETAPKDGAFLVCWAPSVMGSRKPIVEMVGGLAEYEEVRSYGEPEAYGWHPLPKALRSPLPAPPEDRS